MIKIDGGNAYLLIKPCSLDGRYWDPLGLALVQGGLAEKFFFIKDASIFFQVAVSPSTSKEQLEKWQEQAQKKFSELMSEALRVCDILDCLSSVKK